jgi:hypothetical protein
MPLGGSCGHHSGPGALAGSLVDLGVLTEVGGLRTRGGAVFIRRFRDLGGPSSEDGDVRASGEDGVRSLGDLTAEEGLRGFGGWLVDGAMEDRTLRSFGI